MFLFVGGSLFNPLQADVAQAAVDAPVLVKTPPAPQQYTAHGTYAVAAADRDGYDVTVPAPKVVKAVVEEDEADADDHRRQRGRRGHRDPAALGRQHARRDRRDARPGSAQAIALQHGRRPRLGTDQYNCLVSLWNQESGWRVNAYNPSGAYGIPQALPGSKMATAGADWQTNPATQITWGLNYITGVYGTPCGAWAHSHANNWY